MPLALGRIHELVPHDHTEQRASWSRATTAFALFQALGGYGYSYLFGETDEYRLLFAIAAGALVLALSLELVIGRAGLVQHTPEPPPPRGGV